MSVSKVLLGDSILKRLYLKFPSEFDSLSAVTAVSGQKIAELKLIIKENRELLKGKSVIIHIGTNDFLKGTSETDLLLLLKSILKILRNLKCDIVVCEIIPIAVWGVSADSQSAIVKFNKYLHTFVPSGVRVINTFAAFCSEGVVITSYYCKYIGCKRRVDLIHPNSLGLKLLMSLLGSV